MVTVTWICRADCSYCLWSGVIQGMAGSGVISSCLRSGDPETMESAEFDFALLSEWF